MSRPKTLALRLVSPSGEDKHRGEYRFKAGQKPVRTGSRPNENPVRTGSRPNENPVMTGSRPNGNPVRTGFLSVLDPTRQIQIPYHINQKRGERSRRRLPHLV